MYHDLKDKESCAVLHKKERRIYTIAVCLPEYAFFTTAVIAQKVLIIMEGSVSNQNPGRDKRLDKFNHLGSDFRALLQDSGCSNVREYVHSCAFRSLQQLWTVWRTCEDGDVDTLIQRLVCDCSVATYNVDFYHSLKGFDYFSAGAKNERV